VPSIDFGFTSTIVYQYTTGTAGTGAVSFNVAGALASIDIHVQGPGVSLAARSFAGSFPKGVQASGTFVVKNNGIGTDTYQMSCTPTFLACSTSTSTVTLPGGDSANVSVSFTPTGPGNASLTLSAVGTGVSNSVTVPFLVTGGCT
jgi:hypothetical protein